MDKWRKVLIVSPHTDDAELSMGGTIARLRMEGKEIHHAVFSICEESVPEGLPRETLLAECCVANKLFGIKPQIYKYPVRHFPEHRQEILEQMIALRQAIHPDVVFLPSSYDDHQDHEVIHREGLRAYGRRQIDILGYEHPVISSGYRGFRSDMYVYLSDNDLTMKICALSKYKSQKGRAYFDSDFLWSLARVRGVQAGKTPSFGGAEAFEVIRITI